MPAAFNSAQEALIRLQEGNRRFASNLVSLESLLSPLRKAELASRPQCPHAVILGCSDSRVPAEIIFDQGLGDLFVVRVAGNIAAPSQVASIEFAVERFAIPLVVVLGHTDCGAVAATLEALQSPQEVRPGLLPIVQRIRPILENLLAEQTRSSQQLCREAVRAHVQSTALQLRQSSPLLQQRTEEGKLLILGAEYCLETGRVEFLGAPGPGP